MEYIYQSEVIKLVSLMTPCETITYVMNDKKKKKEITTNIWYNKIKCAYYYPKLP